MTTQPDIRRIRLGKRKGRRGRQLDRANPWRKTTRNGKAEAIKAEESENNARTRAEAPRPTSSAPRTTRQGPTTTRHRPPAAQRIGLGQDEGRKSWLSLEQVASIIQLHNKGQMGCNIVTTLLQGTEREDWDNVWKHMRVAEAAEAGNTRGPTPRVRDRLMTYGQLLFRHKKRRNLGHISHEHARSLEGHNSEPCPETSSATRPFRGCV